MPSRAGRSSHSAAPKLPGITLSAFSDSGALGDNKTTFATVNLIGQTSANAIVRLKGTGRSTVADDKGKFLFSDIALTAGKNEFNVVAIDETKQRSLSTTTIRRVAADRVSAIVEWNSTALRAIFTGSTPPPVAARNLAIVHTAMFDAVNSIVDRYKAYQVNLDAPAGASAEAAAVTAAYETLIKLFPTQKATFDAAYQTSLAKIPDGQSETDGIAIGRSVAASILESRKTDGATTPVSYTSSTTPGGWRPSAPDLKPAALPHWGKVTPFTMTSGSQFRPAAPPMITSKKCAEELEQVRVLGRLNSRRRTADQTEIALYWSDGGGTFTPPGHWNQIVGQIAAEGNGTLLKRCPHVCTAEFGTG
ncbi:MAG: hypothetical protein HC895_19575 [Leptolyngbyaceae cyanobacterium SM1_3_5]|nr:hypothetical protein [Leptolyngbyaceae cyanobacterium SM1_3_5]